MPVLRVAVSVVVALVCAPTSTNLAQPGPTRRNPIEPVPFTSVHLTDRFWLPRIETNRRVTIPFAFAQCEKTGRLDHFVRAAKVLRGEPVANLDPPGELSLPCSECGKTWLGSAISSYERLWRS